MWLCFDDAPAALRWLFSVPMMTYAGTCQKCHRHRPVVDVERQRHPAGA